MELVVAFRQLGPLPSQFPTQHQSLGQLELDPEPMPLSLLQRPSQPPTQPRLLGLLELGQELAVCRQAVSLHFQFPTAQHWLDQLELELVLAVSQWAVLP